MEKWPSLLQERSFDHVEGKGAWQNMSRLHPNFYCWENEDRESWIAAMVERWKLEEKNLRHSRPHCIQQYGTNFVGDEQPSLQRDFDGLPKGEIAELTQDGPDLVPPSPVSRPESYTIAIGRLKSTRRTGRPRTMARKPTRMAGRLRMKAELQPQHVATERAP